MFGIQAWGFQGSHPHHPPSPSTLTTHHHHPPSPLTITIHPHHSPSPSTFTTHHHHPPSPLTITTVIQPNHPQKRRTRTKKHPKNRPPKIDPQKFLSRKQLHLSKKHPPPPSTLTKQSLKERECLMEFCQRCWLCR